MVTRHGALGATLTRSSPPAGTPSTPPGLGGGGLSWSNSGEVGGRGPAWERQQQAAQQHARRSLDERMLASMQAAQGTQGTPGMQSPAGGQQVAVVLTGLQGACRSLAAPPLQAASLMAFGGWLASASLLASCAADGQPSACLVVICLAASSGSHGSCEHGAAAQVSPAAGILAGSPLASENGPRMSNAVARSLGLAPPKDLPGARARTLGEPLASAQALV